MWRGIRRRGAQKPVLVHQSGCAPEGAASGRRQRLGVSNPARSPGGGVVLLDGRGPVLAVLSRISTAFRRPRHTDHGVGASCAVPTPCCPWTWLSWRSGRNERGRTEFPVSAMESATASKCVRSSRARIELTSHHPLRVGGRHRDGASVGGVRAGELLGCAMSCGGPSRRR
jgi:hypothetical protein